MKKTEKQQLDDFAKKYAAKEAQGDLRVENAIKAGVKEWMKISQKSLNEYAKKIKKAVTQRRKKVEPWLELQIMKTARLWKMRDRLAAELDMEQNLLMMGVGSTKQITKVIDPRLTSLEKIERTLTADLTALGLNYNSTVSKMKEDAGDGVDENDPMVNYYKNRQR